ncbi:hypothetical protein ACNAN0_04870 [Agrilactobacillus fermenti]|uniref:hypothetical protein n=1 Tax=Agrilactobacillus fermenti TaxID=2586909 RepID=UPI001E3EE894|nr:hypothetical protein [Agrilactobacillus fermenti]MCD2256917.1 hypothetical protein [Agrilactobacillus fermenti]
MKHLKLLILALLSCLAYYLYMSPTHANAAEVQDNLNLLSSAQIKAIQQQNQAFRNAGTDYRIWVYTIQRFPNYLAVRKGDNKLMKADNLERYRKYAIDHATAQNLRAADPTNQTNTTATYAALEQQYDHIAMVLVYPYNGGQRIAFIPPNYGDDFITDFQQTIYRANLVSFLITGNNVMRYFNHYTAFIQDHHIQHHYTNRLTWRLVGHYVFGFILVWLIWLYLLHRLRHPKPPYQRHHTNNTGGGFEEGYMWGYLQNDSQD